MKFDKLNIISASLQHALVIDDSDSSIHYNKAEVSNEAKPLMVSLNDLYKIFKDADDKSDIFSRQFNTENCITLIMKDNTEKTLSGYTANDKPVFLKISTSVLKCTDNDILLLVGKKHGIINKEFPWENVSKQIQDNTTVISDDDDIKAAKDINGYENCQRILKLAPTTALHKYDEVTEVRVPAIEYCISKTVKNKEKTYQGYMPAAGQMKIILDYYKLIDYIFKYMGFDILPFDDQAFFTPWTSTECNQNFAWSVSKRWGLISSHAKVHGNQILPLFKKID